MHDAASSLDTEPRRSWPSKQRFGSDEVPRVEMIAALKVRGWKRQCKSFPHCDICSGAVYCISKSGVYWTSADI